MAVAVMQQEDCRALPKGPAGPRGPLPAPAGLGDPAEMSPPHAAVWREAGGRLRPARLPWDPARYPRVRLGAPLAPHAAPRAAAEASATDSVLDFSRRCLAECYEELAYSRLPFVLGARSLAPSLALGGGTCVVWAEALLAKLARRGLRGHVVPGTLPDRYRRPYTPRGTLGHVAVVLVEGSRAVLLDPCFEIAEPVSVPSAGSSAPHRCGSIGTMRFELDRREHSIHGYLVHGEHSDPVPHVTYLLRPVINPWQSITQPMNEANRFISVVKWSAGCQKLCHLIVDTELGVLTDGITGRSLACGEAAKDDEHFALPGFQTAEASATRLALREICATLAAILEPPPGPPRSATPREPAPGGGRRAGLRG